MKDTEIIAFLRKGKHAAALEALYESFPKIEKLILSKGGTKEEAKDIFQEALIIFYKKVQDSSFELTCQIGTYLYSVARFLWKDELKKQQKNVEWEKEGFEYVEDVIFHEEKEKQFEAIAKAFKQLGKRCEQLLEMFYQQKYSMKKIAQVLRFSNESSAKTQKYKCLEQVKKIAHQEFSNSSNA